jgi:hypothetical protein
MHCEATPSACDFKLCTSFSGIFACRLNWHTGGTVSDLRAIEALHSFAWCQCHMTSPVTLCDPAAVPIWFDNN